jgi:hypothetical protein
MPYRLLSPLFLARLLREPERFNMALALPVSALSAYGSAFLFSRLQQRRRLALALFFFLVVAIVLEYLAVPMLLQSGRVSDAYVHLASETGEFAVLNVPVDPYQSKPYMFAQVVHGRPILQGHSSRYPSGTFEYLDTQPWLREMRKYSDIPPKASDVGRQLAALAEAGVRYLIVHKRGVGEDLWPAWTRYLALVPRFEDDEILIYATEPVPGQDLVFEKELATGVGILRTQSSGPCLLPGQVYELDVAWGAARPPGRELDVQVALVKPDGSVLESVVSPASDSWPADQWLSGAVAWGQYSLQVPEDATEGNVDVVLMLREAQTGEPVGTPVVLEKAHVRQERCAFVPEPGMVGINATYGDQMRLVGYRADREGDLLRLDLDWRADRRIGEDYKVFVHLFDPATGVPVAQSDAMPRNWTYPTSFWVPGEVVRDEVHISLHGVPAGRYGLAVGVYHPASGVRLPVVDASGQEQPDGRLVLAGEEIDLDETRVR